MNTSFPRTFAGLSINAAALICGTLRGGVRNAGTMERPTGTGAPVTIDDASSGSAINARSAFCFVAEKRRRMPSRSYSKLPCAGVAASLIGGGGVSHFP